jgi:hypothetical protein
MTWRDEQVIEDGYIFSYEITQPADVCSRRGHIDDWYPDEGAHWELTGIHDAETGESVTIDVVVEDWTVDDADEAMKHISKAIERDIDAGR